MSGGQSLYSLVVYGLSVIGSIRKFYSILGVFGTQFRFFLPHIQICRSSRTSKEFTDLCVRCPSVCVLFSNSSGDAPWVAQFRFSISGFVAGFLGCFVLDWCVPTAFECSFFVTFGFAVYFYFRCAFSGVHFGP